MKKFLLATLATTAMVGTANAGSLNLDLRGDWNGQDYDSAPGKADNSKFQLQLGRLDFQGKLNEEVNYRVRWRFAGKNHTSSNSGTTPGNPQSRDNTFQDLDFAYVQNKMSDMMTLTIGKLGSDIGGFEGQSNSADFYFTSEAYGGTGYLGGGNANNTTTGTSLNGFTNMLYYTGAKLAFMFADQEINIQAANVETQNGRTSATGGAPGTGDHTGANGFDQNQASYGIVWKGKFGDHWQARASYHFMPTQTTATDKIDFYALGGQFSSDSWLVQLDYLMNSYKENAAGQGTDTLSSIVLTGKWMFSDNMTAILKMVYSMEKLDDTTSIDNKYMSEGLAFEYKPKKEDMFRYHVAYNYRQEKPNDGDDRKLSEVIVGTRILADFLK